MRSSSVRKWFKIPNIDLGLYKDIPIFLLVMLVFFIVTSFLAYYYIGKNISNYHSWQLEQAKNALNHGLLEDLLKLKTYSGIIGSDLQTIHSEEAIQAVLSKYEKKIELSLLRAFKLCVTGGGLSCTTPDSALIAYEHLIDDRMKLKVYLDLIEVTKIIKNSINPDIIITLEKAENKANEKNQIVLPVSEVFSINLSINPNIFIKAKRGLLLKISWIAIAGYGSGIILYFIIRYLLNHFLYKSYKSEIEKLKYSDVKNKGIINTLSTELDNAHKHTEAIQYEKKMFDVLFENAALIEHFSNILLKVYDNKVKLDENTQKKCLQQILECAVMVRRRIVRDNAGEVNIKYLVKLAIGILSSEIQLKGLKIINNCEIESVNLGIGQYTLLQIILNILSYQIFSLPHGKEIIVCSSISRKGELILNFKDNGFGFTFSEFKNHLSSNVKVSSFILDWEVFEKVLQENKATLNYSKQKVGSRLVITISSKEQASKSEAQEVVAEHVNTNEKDNIYFLHDYKKI